MLVIGTAGHIDHGKSSIVKRLTGTDPDRLPEEQARGLTIDLGFAFYGTPDDDTIAFVDVPGHERFVKNMVAGAGGIDAVMLVVAADDGWMPQSEEHFQIVRLLGVRRGLIVINKIDLVESDWLELLEAEIRGKVAGTFLESVPIVKLSAATGDGFGPLREFLNQLPAQLQAKKDIGKARLYIDRSFVRPGIGGVVTGTLRGGTLSVGQTVGVWPSGKQAKVRSLHSNNADVETAVPGQRTAVSFTGLDKELLIRGGVISGNTDLSYYRDHPVLAMSVEMLPGAPVPLTDRRRILMIVGTTEVEGEIRIYDTKQINPGQGGLIFFMPDEPCYSLVGDHYIARLPTPMVTIGGGQVLDHLQHFPRHRHTNRYAYLKQRMACTVDSLVLSELHKHAMVPAGELLVNSDFSANEIEATVKRMWQGKTVKLFEGAVYHQRHVDETVGLLSKRVTSYIEGKTHVTGLTVEQIAKIADLSVPETDLLIRFMLGEGLLVKVKDVYNLPGKEGSLKGPVKSAHDDIMKQLSADRFGPPTLTILAGKGKAYRDAIKVILDTGQGYKVGSDFVFLAEAWDELTAFIREKLKTEGKLTVADLRDRFGVSRKFCIPILEETDRIKLTRRDGDLRIRGENFES